MKKEIFCTNVYYQLLYPTTGFVWRDWRTFYTVYFLRNVFTCN